MKINLRYLRNWRWWAMLLPLLALGLVAVWGPIFGAAGRGMEWLGDKIDYNKPLSNAVDWTFRFIAKREHQ